MKYDFQDLQKRLEKLHEKLNSDYLVLKKSKLLLEIFLRRENDKNYIKFLDKIEEPVQEINTHIVMRMVDIFNFFGNAQRDLWKDIYKSNGFETNSLTESLNKISGEFENKMDVHKCEYIYQAIKVYVDRLRTLYEDDIKDENIKDCIENVKNILSDMNLYRKNFSSLTGILNDLGKIFVEQKELSEYNCPDFEFTDNSIILEYSGKTAYCDNDNKWYDIEYTGKLDDKFKFEYSLNSSEIKIEDEDFFLTHLINNI